MIKTFKPIIFILLLSLAINLIANDGRYLSNGSVIFPMQDNNIELTKEILSFSCRNMKSQVHIQFTFDNKENIEKKILVGFQAPNSFGDVDKFTLNNPPIQNFTIQFDGNIIPYTVKMAECEDCPLKDVGSIKLNQASIAVFVYLFEITFKPGINVINHSYEFQASERVDIKEVYDYILTTGAKWKNKTIKELKVEIVLGENINCFVQNSFGNNAVWNIIGTGKILNKQIFEDTISYKLVRIVSGKLEITVKNLEPKQNIRFGMLNHSVFIDKFGFDENESKVYKALLFSSIADETYTKEELRLIRNSVYAKYGYVFKSKDLIDYFNKFECYIPNPNLRMEEISLTKDEKKLINEITAREKLIK